MNERTNERTNVRTNKLTKEQTNKTEKHGCKERKKKVFIYLDVVDPLILRIHLSRPPIKTW